MENKYQLVSVLMTAYNRELYIAEAIESILNSTYKNIELIICDDASTDGTVAIARSYSEIDERVKIYINEVNLGQFPNRNKAADYAKGKYIKYLDSDDTIYDWGLAYCVELMERYPAAGMGIFQAAYKVNDEYIESKKAVRKHFFDNNFLSIGPSGTILKRDAFEKIGRYNPNYGVPSDMYFNIKMASLFPIVMLKKEFFYYREHNGQEIKNRDSYLFYNYPYLRDLLMIPDFPLNEKDKNSLLAAAKKSLIRACLSDIKNSRRILPSLKAIRLSRLTSQEIIKSLF